MPETIGLVGCGLVGQALAERLLQAGFTVLGFDPVRERLAELGQVGGSAADTTEQVFHDCRRVLLSLPDASVVTEVIAQAEPMLASGHLIVDTTTGDPEDVAVLGNKLHGQDVQYVDATIAGSSEQVRQRDVLVLAGGTEAGFTACQDLLDTFSKQSFHLGPWGAGSRMKLVLNLVLGLQRAALAEGLAFAESLRLDLGQVLQILRQGPTAGQVLETKGQRMILGDYAPQARLRQHRKDVGLILKAGELSSARLPFSRLHAELLDELLATGWGDADNSAIVEAFRGSGHRHQRWPPEGK